MSDTVRSYTGSKPLRRMRRPRQGSLLGVLFRAVFVILVVVLGAVCYWTTRDTHDIFELIPAHQKYSIVLKNILGNRDKIAKSAVWEALPSSLGANRVPKALGGDSPLPDWVMRNLIVEDCYISGNDLHHFDDVLLVTKMSRIGRLIEYLHSFMPEIEGEQAGGLCLRRLNEPNMYYAVRGRVLVASPSRDALIRSLTLRPEDAIGEEAFTATFSRSGTEDLRGAGTFAEGDPLGDVLQYVRFSVRIDPTQTNVNCSTMLRPEWQERLSAILDGLTPRELMTPPEGMVVLSANLNKPVKDVWLALGHMIDSPLFSEEQWKQWEAMPTDEPPGIPNVLTALLGSAGPSMQLSWCGTDLNEMVPLPEIVGVFETRFKKAEDIFAGLPGPPAEALPWESYPRYDPESKRVSVPMIGGPSLEITAGTHGDGMLVSTSRTVAERMLAAAPMQQPLGRPGNLYVRVKPHDCVQTLVDAAALLVEMDMLKGVTRDTFDSAAARWLEPAARVDEVATLLSFEGEEISGEFTLVCAPPRTQ